MQLLRLACTIPFVIAAAASVFAASLDFPAATCRIKIGAQTTHFSAASAGRSIAIDGQPAQAGERLNSLMRVNWIIAASNEVGDEYVFTVRRPGEKPKTYSAVFKGGYLQLVSDDKLLIEIED